MLLGIATYSRTFPHNTPESTWSVTNSGHHNHGTDPDRCFLVAFHKSIIPNIGFEVLDRSGGATTPGHRHRHSDAFKGILQQFDVGSFQAVQILNLYPLATARKF